MEESVVFEALIEGVGVPLCAAEVRVEELGGSVTNLRLSSTQAGATDAKKKEQQRIWDEGLCVWGGGGEDAISQRLAFYHRR